MAQRKYTQEELNALADKMDAMGYHRSATIARRGFPGIASGSLRKEKAERAKLIAKNKARGE